MRKKFNQLQVHAERIHFQDFVIAHELLQLRVPTHERLIKALMSAHAPGWREFEEQRGTLRMNCEERV